MSKRRDSPFIDDEVKSKHQTSRVTPKGTFDIGKISNLPTFNDRCPPTQLTSVKNVVRSSNLTIEPDKFKLYQLLGENLITIDDPLHNRDYYAHLTTTQESIRLEMGKLDLLSDTTSRVQIVLKRGQLVMLMNRQSHWIILEPYIPEVVGAEVQ